VFTKYRTASVLKHGWFESLESRQKYEQENWILQLFCPGRIVTRTLSKAGAAAANTDSSMQQSKQKAEHKPLQKHNHQAGFNGQNKQTRLRTSVSTLLNCVFSCLTPSSLLGI
jgi:hypothetical protein